jgi:hypothetical protein
MGIEAQIESERGQPLLLLSDPRGYVNWLLSFAPLDGTICLRFIDPYGNTIFNGLQLPLLKRELESVAGQITESNLVAGKKDYLERATTWPARAIQEARERVDSLSVSDLEGHLVRLIALVAEAIERGAHHYVRFIGD